jgi:hypothetical protein
VIDKLGGRRGRYRANACITLGSSMRLIALLLFAVACGRADKPPDQEPKSAAPLPPKVAKEVAQTVDELTRNPPEKIADKDRAAAVDPKALVGTWKIKQLIGTIDHKARPPEEPIVPGTWTFKADGTWHKAGGNELDGKFVLTPKALIIEAIGPALEYHVDKLTATELVVTTTIMDGMSNSTVLERVK